MNYIQQYNNNAYDMSYNDFALMITKRIMLCTVRSMNRTQTIANI